MLGSDPRRALDLAGPVVAATGGVEARLVLGAALRRVAELDSAFELLAVLANALPGVWGVHYEHGMTLAALGRCETAAAALGCAVALNPGSSLAVHALGDQLAMLGQAVEAARLHGSEISGLAGDARLADGVAALFDGDAATADAILKHFGMHLCDLATVSLVADVGLRLGKYEAVAALLATAIGAAPAFLPARYRRAVALFQLEQGEAALAEIEVLLTARPGVPAFVALRAAIRMQLGDAHGAVEDYAAVVASDPDDGQLRHSHGHALRAVGRQAEAVAAYRHAIALRPDFGEAYWSLANLKTWRFADTDREAMAALLASDETSPEDRSYLGFALGKALEDDCRYAEALDHYSAANALRRAAKPHDAAAASTFTDHNIEIFDAGFFSARTGWGDPAADPIFVVGMPRSGSTLVEQILASHSAVESASELPDLTAIARRLAHGGSYPSTLGALRAEDFAALGREYLDRTRVRRRLERPHFVDKFPGNFLHAGLIHLMLPNARIIDVRRDPRACCVSLFKQAFAQGQAYSYDLADLGNAYRDYRRLMAHFERVLPGRIVRVDYETLVEKPELQIRRLLDACGLEFEPGCLRFFEAPTIVRTPSSEQVRRPIFRDGLDQWRNFAPWLGPLEAALGDALPTDDDR